jgi:phosphopantetheinyl transferase
MSGTDKRRREWLLGRLVAKDAVRLLLRDRSSMELGAADLEIVVDENGRPQLGGAVGKQLDVNVALSICHSAGSAVAAAVAGEGSLGVGIDIEWMGQYRQDLVRGALDDREHILLAGLHGSDRDEWLLRLWCAKEAMAKALGTGMGGTPTNLLVQDVDARTGRVMLGITRELAGLARVPEGLMFLAHTGREGDLVFATSLIESESRGACA